MSIDKTQLTKLFSNLLELSLDDDQEVFDLEFKKITDLGYSFVLETKETEEWDESQIDGYAEFPTVTQECKLLLGNVVVAEWERQFGIEMIDATHTGGGGKWSPFRLDDFEGSDIENFLDMINIEIPYPDVPEPKAIVSEAINLTITESALNKISELIAEEGNPALMLRIYYSHDDTWGFQFGETSEDGDCLMDFSGVKVLVAGNVSDSLKNATVDFNKEGGFSIANAENPELSS
jgi:Fe-S cluster assembly iron-binding protein IscA